MPANAFRFDNTYARELPGFYVPGGAARVPSPRLIRLNVELAAELGLDLRLLDAETAAGFFSGNTPPTGACVLAQAYAGHQFGHFVPQLGDGRALLLGEVVDVHGRRRDIQLKGSGRTAFSRGGDGKAALGPVLREYLLGEAMHALGIPTTRALAAVATGEPVRRERPLPGAVLTRVAASHIRVGTFQFFAARGDGEKARRLADYAIARHYPDLAGGANPYISFLSAVRDAQAALIAKWMLVGFIHGVMNTDNMAVSGETIDYGPCAFLDSYHSATVFSSIDQHGRYAYGRQPSIAVWNLSRLAETILPLIDSDEKAAVDRATEMLRGFWDVYDRHWMQGMRRKLGIDGVEDAGDRALATDFLQLLEDQRIDYTLAFRRLAAGMAAALFPNPAPFTAWAERWRERRTMDESAMNSVNPIYIPRNHQVEAALAAAEGGDFGLFETLCDVISQPFIQRAGLEVYASPAPDGNPRYRTFCGT